MISMGRFILQNESLKMVYFLIVSYGKIWKVRTFFFGVSPKYRENSQFVEVEA